MPFLNVFFTKNNRAPYIYSPFLSTSLLACFLLSPSLLVCWSGLWWKEEGSSQSTVQSGPIGSRLLTQPRPLHSSICTAVLSLLTPPPPFPPSLIQCATLPTHLPTHIPTHSPTHTHIPVLEFLQCCCSM